MRETTDSLVVLHKEVDLPTELVSLFKKCFIVVSLSNVIGCFECSEEFEIESCTSTWCLEHNYWNFVFIVSYFIWIILIKAGIISSVSRWRTCSFNTEMHTDLGSTEAAVQPGPLRDMAIKINSENFCLMLSDVSPPAGPTVVSNWWSLMKELISPIVLTFTNSLKNNCLYKQLCFEPVIFLPPCSLQWNHKHFPCVAALFYGSFPELNYVFH